MSSAVCDAQICSDLSRLEAIEAVRSNVTVTAAREIIARKTALSSSTFENIRRGRAKRISAFVAERVRLLFVSELQAEMKRLEHDLAMALARGAKPDSYAIRTALSALSDARALIKEAE